MSFVTGFCKSARDKAKKNEKNRGLLAAGGAISGQTLGLAAGLPLGLLATRQGKTPARPKSMARFLRKAQKHHNIDLAHGWRPHAALSEYEPRVFNNRSRGGGVVHASPKGHEGILAHEVGHAIDFHRKGLGRSKSVKPRLVMRAAGPLAGIAGAGLLGSSEDERVRKYAPVAASAGFLPALSQEARATYYGTKELARQRGKKRALRSLARTLPAFGSYAAPAIGAGALTHFLMKGPKKKSGATNKKDKK